MNGISSIFIAILLIVVTFTTQIETGNALTDDDHLPLSVSIPEDKAYNITNQKMYTCKFVTLYFLVEHDWVYANQLQKDLITVECYRYNLDNQGYVDFTPYSQHIEYHYYPDNGRSVTEINSIRLANLSKGEHSIQIYAKMSPIIARYSSMFGTIVDIGSTTSYSNTLNFTIDSYIPEFHSWIILPLFITGCLVVVGFRKKLRAVS
jgi:hypothetical protein